MRRGWLVLLLLVTTPLFAGITEDEHAQAAKTEELEKLRENIRALEQDLNTVRTEQDELRNELRTMERNIGRLGPSVNNLNRQLRQKNEELQKLQAEKRVKKTEIDENRRLLAEYMRARYIMGREDRMKLLLNLNDPEAIGRTLAYYDYLNQARSKHIHRLEENMAAIKVLEDKIETETASLNDLHAAKERELETLEDNRRARRQVLTKLNGEARTKQTRLERLQGDEKALESLVTSLRQAIAEAKIEAEKKLDFAQLKGQLPWPIQGRLLARYGSLRPQSGGLKWRGVLIDAREGEAVHAIYQGRVIFAEWLRGFGLLIILDHGNGYMSLYGHNQSLSKAVGDWVEKEEIIAAAGNTGGGPDSGLYFEIRHSGAPLDPSQWCKTDKIAKRKSKL